MNEIFSGKNLKSDTSFSNITADDINYIINKNFKIQSENLVKYKNKITELDGIKFHSKKEAQRYFELKQMNKMNLISDLKIQPKIPLLVNSIKIGYYIGDFYYYDKQTKKYILEDVKSKITKTPLYNLKKKILLTYKPPVVITEIF